MRPEEILARLDPEQRQAVLAPRTPLLISAGAGTGKTTTATSRIAYGVATGVVAPGQILAITHSSRAAGELRHRLQRLRIPGIERVTARTFHAAALKQLSHFWRRTGLPHELRVMDSRYSAARAAVRHVERADPDTATVIDVSSEIGWAKSQRTDPEGYARLALRHGRTPPRSPERFAEIFASYEEARRNAGLIDFEDMLALTASLILADEEVAQAVRARYSSFTVDEFQDTDPLQYHLLEAWRGGSPDVTVVGDARQCVYQFKGADISIIEGFASQHPGARTVELVRDYRSTPQVVALANRLASDHTPIQGMRAPGPAPRLTTPATEDEEAAWVASEVTSHLAQGVPASEIAVLYRFNSQAVAFEQALTSRGIPYRVADTDRFFERPEIREVCDRLRTGVARLAQQMRGEWDAEDQPPEAELDEVMPPGLECLRETLRNVGFDPTNPPPGAGAARDRFEALAALLRLCEELPSAELLGAHALVREVEHRRTEAMHTSTSVVTLATLHKSKGLEWDVVFLPRLTEGSLPSTYATLPQQLDEERRLAYVGITRAREILHLSHPRSRDGRYPAKPSRFLTELGLLTPPPARSRTSQGGARGTGVRAATPARSRGPKVTGPGVTSASAAPRPRSHGQCAAAGCTTSLSSAAHAHFGRCTAHLEGDAAAAFERLRAWRLETAAGKPAFTVLTDSTLLELVQHRPTTQDELVKIPGIGTVKRQRWGKKLLELVSG